MSGRSRSLVHETTAPGAGSAPRDAPLSDRQRLGVLLQGAALLAHARRAGRWVGVPWSSARVTPGGRLVAVEAAPGSDPEPPQRRMADLLLEVFAADRTVAGRGEARRIARRLLALWAQEVESVSEERLVGQIVSAAPMVWEDDFAESRSSLAALIDGEVHIAGRGGFRRRVLTAATDLEAARSLLASYGTQHLWSGGTRRDPVGLVDEGRWQLALATWADEPPATPDGRFDLARALYAVGRFGAAKQQLHGLRRERARVLRLGCQLRLGELAAVKRGLTAWSRRPPAGEALVDLTAMAVRLFANLGEPERAAPWLELAANNPGRSWRPRGVLLAAESAWDRGDVGGMEAALGAVGEVDGDADLAWRKAQVRGLLAISEGRGEVAVEQLSEALAYRRRQRPFEAAGLWNDLALGRALTGDLAGAERALRHVVRLTGDGAGERRTTLALCNLAEVLLRRGRLAGVADAIERSVRTNEGRGNWRGWSHDQALRARYELVCGRPGAAVQIVERALEELEQRDCDWGVGLLLLVAARAHGWLGDPEAAADALERVPKECFGELEPEELPALHALAGDPATAAATIDDGPIGGLWRGLIGGGGEPDWDVLGDLEPYRSARLVFDLELLGVGPPPRHWRRRSAAALRAVGAAAMAERLAGDTAGPWEAVRAYLDGGGTWEQRLTELVTQVSPDARLSWRDDEREVLLVPGLGGREAIERPSFGGRLWLSGPRCGPTEGAVLALAARDLPSDRVAAAAVGRSRAGARAMIGNSTGLTEALDRLAKLAARDMPILIEGETGTGKELAAREVHRRCARAAAPFVPVNCAELSETLLVSELFGHVRGAFTGADRDRVGFFESASGGIVFLDEIGDLPLLAQGKLLRVLQEGEVRRVGESVSRPVDVRVVAATHRDLSEMVAQGAFRQDLLFRLRVGTVSLPPLRERGGDLFMLVEHFLADESPGVVHSLSEGARQALAAHSWPGNVRELRGVLTVAAALAEGGAIRREHLDLPESAQGELGGYHEQVEALRRRLVRDALAESGGNRAEAARRLGLSRQALSYLVRQLDID